MAVTAVPKPASEGDAFTRAAVSAGGFACHATGRDDLYVMIHGEPPLDGVVSGGRPVSAWFQRDRGVINLVASLLDAGSPAPAHLDFMRPTVRFGAPVISGALIHAAAHAAYTHWTVDVPADAAAGDVSAARLLEEGRIEAKWIAAREIDSPLLHASAAHVVLSSVTDVDDETQAAKGFLSLILPRVLGGVFPVDSTAAAFRGRVVGLIGEDGVQEFEAVIRSVLGTADDDAAGMVAAGGRWVELMARHFPEDDSGDPGPGGGGCGGSQGGPEGGSGPSSNAPDTGSESRPDADESRDDGSDTAGESPDTENPHDVVEGEGSGQDGDTTSESAPGHDPLDLSGDLRRAVAETGQDAAAENRQRAAGMSQKPAPHPDDEQRHRNAVEASAVFGAGTQLGAVRVRRREPTDADRAARRLLTARLRRAQYRNSTKTRHDQSTPAGKMRSSGLVGMASQIARQVPMTAKPWRQTRVRVEDRPPITGGIAVDASGSMGAWFTAAGACMWSLAGAIGALGGRSAAVAFSGSVVPLVSPGHIPVTVPVLANGGGSTGCGDAIGALDGALNLSGQRGARIVVVLTDSALPDTAQVQRSIDYVHRNGVPVVWAVTTPAPHWIPNNVTPALGVEPGTFATVVADACEAALRASTARA